MNATFSNELTSAQLERLAILSEECGEVVQAIGKILRHGYESSHPLADQGPNNREHLLKELYDLRAAMLMVALDLPDQTEAQIDGNTIAALRRKLQWTHHQGGDFAQFISISGDL